MTTCKANCGNFKFEGKGTMKQNKPFLFFGFRFLLWYVNTLNRNLPVVVQCLKIIPRQDALRDAAPAPGPSAVPNPQRQQRILQEMRQLHRSPHPAVDIFPSCCALMGEVGLFQVGLKKIFGHS